MMTDPRHEALKKVEAFLKDLDDAEADPSELLRGQSWWRAGEGLIVLDPNEDREYQACLAELVRRFGSDETISKKAIERLLVDAIFEVLDIPGERQDYSRDERINGAVSDLRKGLTGPRVEYRIYQTVAGLGDEGLPFEFGRVVFRSYGSEVQKELEHEEGAEGQNVISERIHEDRTGRKIGVVAVNAADSNAALRLGRREVERTIDVLNFFSDLTPYNHAWLALPGRVQSGHATTPYVREGDPPFISYNLSRVGPIGTYSMKKLTSADARYNLGLTYASGLLVDGGGAPQERLVAGLRWAGRGTVEQRRDLGFLLYMIALESVLLPEGDKQDLSYRLRLRAAHVIGEDSESRHEVYARITGLYRTRSSIVHTGDADVSEEDLAYARRYCKMAMLKLLRAGADNGPRRIDNLVRWAEDQLLG